MKRLVTLLALFAFLTPIFALLLSPQPASAQGVLIHILPDDHVILPRPIIIYPPPHPIPRPIPQPVPSPPPSTYKIKELSVTAKLQEQVAKVQVTQSFVNTGSRQMEVAFVFPLPYDGAIDQLTLMVDGKEFAAKLLDAKEARKMYEEIVRKNQDPALLEWIGSGLFKTSVFPVPPGAERKITLKYSQLCRKLDGATDFLFPLSTAKYTSHPVETVSFNLSIESESDIKNVYCPTHSVEIKRPDNKHANITYTSKNEVPTSDFRLMYDVGKGHVGTTVYSYRPKDSEDGYFMMLTTPEIKSGDDRPKKTVTFVLDRSGSMAGQKFDQAKNAMKFLINNLRENDLFNIVTFDSVVESYKPELQRYNDESRKAAIGFVEGLFVGGGTNIDGGLTTAFNQVKDTKRPTYMIFLTDGIPTAGEVNEAKIAANAKTNNTLRARMFAFGVGYDLNARLLDKLVRDNFGISEYVRPNEDIEARVSSLYNRIGAPVMTDVTIKYDLDNLKTEDGPPVTRVYPKDTRDLFQGEQLVVVGRYKKPGAAKVTINGKVGESEQKFDFPAKFVEKSGDESFAFIEKLWAMRRVGEILDELDLKGKNDELVKELVSLATKHGILTPYTSFLADDRTNIRDVAANTLRTHTELKALELSDGKDAVAQRASKNAFRQAGDANNAANYGIAAEAAKAAARPTASGPAGAPGVGGGAAHGLATGQINAPASGGRSVYIDRDDTVKVVNNVRQVGNRAFYYRNNQWVDSNVTEKQEKEAIQIKRFSQEYFDLIDKHGKEVTKYMVSDEPVTVELGGKAYSF